MRHLSRQTSIACLAALLLTVQPAAAFPFPFNLNGLHNRERVSQSQTDAQAQLPRSIQRQVRRTIARTARVPFNRLRIAAATRETWRDGCLGLGGAAEICSMALVSGWRVTVTNGTQTWIYRTNSTGRSLRQESQTGSSAIPQSVSDSALAAASQASGIPIAGLRLTQAEEKTWDGCLGIGTGISMCPQVAIPGWRVVVAGNGRSWVYHTNGDGGQIVLNQFATAGLEGIRFLSDWVAPLDDEVLFRSIASGSMTGYTYETVLLKNGQIIRSLLRADQAAFPPQIYQISQAQVEQFEALLQDFWAFDRLSYPAVHPIPDAITMTLSSHGGTTKYVDAIADRLPPDLLAVVQAWGAIVHHV